jgi:preprotein translocase subunit Sss1
MATDEDPSIINSFETLEVSSIQKSRKTTSNIHEYCRKPSEEEPVRDSQN